MSFSSAVKEFIKMFQTVAGDDKAANPLADVKPETVDAVLDKLNVPSISKQDHINQVEQRKRVNKTQEESIQEMFQRMFAADQIRKAKEQERLKNQMEQDVEKQQQSVRIDEENQSEIESRLTGSSSRKLRI